METKHPAAPAPQILRKVFRQRHHDVAAHKCLEALARQAHISVLVLAYRRDVIRLLLDELAADVAQIITAFRREVCDAVADAKRALMREEFRMDHLAVKGARHDPEGAQAALCRALSKFRRDRQKRQKIRRAESLRDFLVKDRPFLGKAVRAIFLELVREVAARDEYDAAAELFCRLCDLLAEPVVDISAEAREADTHDLDRLFELRLQEVERDHRAVVERRLPLAEESGRKIVCRTGIRQCL